MSEFSQKSLKSLYQICQHYKVLNVDNPVIVYFARVINEKCIHCNLKDTLHAPRTCFLKTNLLMLPNAGVVSKLR